MIRAFTVALLLTVAVESYADPTSAVVIELAEDYGEAGGQLLDRGWRWRPDDDSRYADPGYDDSDWEIAVSWNPHRTPGDSEIAWFRIRLRIPPSLRGRAVPFWLTQCGASEAYLNGEKVGEFGVVAAAPDLERPEFANALTRKYLALPMSTDEEQLLAIRHSNANGQEIWHGELGRVRGFAIQAFAGSPSEGFASFVGQASSLATHRTFQIVVATAFAVLHFLLFAFYPASGKTSISQGSPFCTRSWLALGCRRTAFPRRHSRQASLQARFGQFLSSPAPQDAIFCIVC